MIRARIGICFVPLLALFAGCSEIVGDATPAPAPAPASASPVLAGATLELAPPPRELIYLEITPDAARTVKRHIDDLELKRWWLRYTLAPGGCTGFQNKLDIDTGPPTDRDFEFVANGVPCLILKSQRHLAQGARIDFGQKDGQSGFIVTAPHASARTKEAVSKWVNEEIFKGIPDISSVGSK
ncbi:hypothetical protein J8F10_21890 [Gemmata sp. G18]|uniref:Core domain-containing protein n=1 Tax=Gemmata palustris TaxID=2822762 RepID=A0ABS5BW71_9BACT|nr:iron-sulfur cluster biosynthesis family protein [Gemmata palustris]MBP3957915.1 hypothetical protein [Gemmata palustris]